MVQLLQGTIIEYNTENFDQISKVMPGVIPYIIKSKNIRKLVEFVNICVTPPQFT